MSKVYVKPAPERAVPVPERGGALLAEAGEWVPKNAYWVRRLNDGDAIETEAPPVEADAPVAAKKGGAK